MQKHVMIVLIRSSAQKVDVYLKLKGVVKHHSKEWTVFTTNRLLQHGTNCSHFSRTDGGEPQKKKAKEVSIVYK